MGKPEDIPQDVWDAAVHAFHDDWDNPPLVMARAIMAAKAEEREACLSIVRERIWTDPDRASEIEFGGHLTAVGISDEIRRRGEG